MLMNLKKAKSTRDIFLPLSTTTTISSSSSSSSPSPSPSPSPSDLLTSLPDSLRIHILTLLPYRSAVVTGGVSKQWRDLSRSRWPFPSTLLLFPSSSSSSAQEDDEHFARHVDILILLLLLHNHELGGPHHDALHISAPPSVTHCDLRRWLHYASATSVADLSLSLAGPDGEPGPTLLYLKFAPILDEDLEEYDMENDDDYDGVENPHLVRLCLANLNLILPPPPILKRFTALEQLSLYNVHIVDSALTRLMLRCPLLCAVEIRRCRTLDQIKVPHYVARLVSIVIADCDVTNIAIWAPNVKKFHFSGRYVMEFSLGETVNLEDVFISCGRQEACLPRANWVEALRGLSQVRVLTLCSLSLQCVTVSGADTDEEFLSFPNLKELQLVMRMMIHTNVMDICDFFRLCHFPSLEKLFIELPTHMHDPYVENFLDPAKKMPWPEIDLLNLKIVKFKNFNGHQYEMQMVRFLLSRAIHLESLIIVVPRELSEGEEYSCDDDCWVHNLRVQLAQISATYSYVQIVMSGHDDIGVRPTHFGVYSKV